jgi:putative ABC transport system permease protein
LYKAVNFIYNLSSFIIITVCLAGVFPAIYVSNFETLKGIEAILEEVKWRLVTKWNVDFSICCCDFFIIGSYIVYQQIDYMNKKDLGFKANQILSISYRNVWRGNNRQF